MQSGVACETPAFNVRQRTEVGAAITLPSNLIPSGIHTNSDGARITLDFETAAIQMLADTHEDQQQTVMRFLDVVLRATVAESAGVSLAEKTFAGSASLRWIAVAGRLSRYEGRITARELSPCGSCMKGARAVVMQYPLRAFTDLKDIEPIITELLIVPLSAAGKVVGTLWLAVHDESSHFCSDDARAAKRLALYLDASLQRYSQDAEHRRALADRDTVVRDAHHRVMNTLQLATSLLRLPGRSDAASHGALAAAAERLQMLAKVHQLLAVSGRDVVELLPLLQEIVSAANELFSTSEHRVRIRLEAEQFTFAADQAIPLVLLVHEAVANACKHAFPNNAQGGVVRVAVKLESAHMLVIRVADDGVGLPAQRSTGLGLAMIRNFAEQLNALLTFETPASGFGTSVIAKIHLDEAARKRLACAAA